MDHGSQVAYFVVLAQVMMFRSIWPISTIPTTIWSLEAALAIAFRHVTISVYIIDVLARFA